MTKVVFNSDSKKNSIQIKDLKVGTWFRICKSESVYIKTDKYSDISALHNTYVLCVNINAGALLSLSDKKEVFEVLEEVSIIEK